MLRDLIRVNRRCFFANEGCRGDGHAFPIHSCLANHRTADTRVVWTCMQGAEVVVHSAPESCDVFRGEHKKLERNIRSRRADARGCHAPNGGR